MLYESYLLLTKIVKMKKKVIEGKKADRAQNSDIKPSEIIPEDVDKIENNVKSNEKKNL